MDENQMNITNPRNFIDKGDGKMDDKTYRVMEIAEYKTKMEVQRKEGHMMAYRDLKKHYDKLVSHK